MPSASRTPEARHLRSPDHRNASRSTTMTQQYQTHTPAELPEQIRHYINGEFVDSADGATFGVISPVTNETYIQASAGSKADIDRAVTAAQRAFDEGTWSQALPRERSRVLHKIADLVETRGDRLAELESFDPGDRKGGGQGKSGDR